MKRSRIILGICLVAFAISAIGAASASAASPEFFTCKKESKPTYKFSTATCSTEAPESKGTYERVTPKFPVKLKGTVGATKFFIYNPETSTIEARVACAKGKNEEELTSTRNGTLKLTYEKCEAVGGKFPGPCTTPGQLKLGNIVTEKLATKLVWLDGAETQAGLLSTGAGEAQTVSKVTCGGGLVEVTQFGSELAPIGPVNTTAAVHTYEYGANETTGARAYSSYYEGGLSVEATFNTKLDVGAPFNIHYPKIPTSEISTQTLKGATTLGIGA